MSINTRLIQLRNISLNRDTCNINHKKKPRNEILPWKKYTISTMCLEQK